MQAKTSKTIKPLAILLLANFAFSGTASAMQNSDREVISTNIKSFTVPFKIDNSRKNYIEVQLYTSDDQGKNWKFYAKQNANGSGFRFNSDGDGEYWFALKTLNRDRQLIPPGEITNPELKIVVDSKDPKIKFNIDSDAAGRIITSWEIADSFLDPQSLKIMHRGTTDAGANQQWLPVEYKPASNIKIAKTSMIDRIAWWPQTLAKRVEVKIEIADAAGNVSTETGFVSLPNIARHRSNSNSTTTTNQFQKTSSSSGSWKQRTNGSMANQQKPKNVICENGVCRLVDTPSKNINNLAQLPNNQRPSAPLVGSQPEYISPPIPNGYVPEKQSFASVTSKPNQNDTANKRAAKDSIVWNSDASGWTGQKQTNHASTLNRNDFPIDTPPKKILGGNRFKNLPVVTKRTSQPKQDNSSKEVTQTDDLVVSQSTTYGKGSSSRQQTRNKTSANNSFEFPSADSAFANTGQFKQVATSPKRFVPPSKPSDSQSLSVNTRRFNLNYDVQAIDQSGVGKVVLWVTRDNGFSWNSMAEDPDNTSPFPVAVDGEGSYGFKVVINSRDGIIGKAPVSGDKPDVTVQVDLTVPTVALTSAPYGSGNDIGKLIIHWDAFDEFMIERPINLLYSPGAAGPWTTIQNRLRNTGSYAWKVPAQVPEQIFLRIEAKDAAGNKGIYQLTAPIDISGLVPRGRIYGVDPVR